MLILIATLATTEVSAGAVAKADQYTIYRYNLAKIMIFAQKQKIQSTNLLALCLTKCNLTYNDFSTKSMDRLASPILVINADKSIMTIKSKFSTQGLMINFFIKLCFITIVILLLS